MNNLQIFLGAISFSGNRLYTVSHIVALNSSTPKLDKTCHCNNKMRKNFQIFYYKKIHFYKIASSFGARLPSFLS